MIVKKHKTINGQIILAVCDSNLAGKKFIEGDLQLDLSSDFYKGEEVNEEKIKELLKQAYIVNLAGKKCVGFALKLGIVEESHIIKIGGIPHAQCVIIRGE